MGPQWFAGLALAAAMAAPGAATTVAASSDPVIAGVDLAKPFATRTAWRFVATQGPNVIDPSYTDGGAPGVVKICLAKQQGAPCFTPLEAMPRPPASMSPDSWVPHYLKTAQVVRPARSSARPLLLLKTASLYSGDGDQAIFTQLLAYSRATDRFEQVYAHVNFHNNNQEDRILISGPLAGDVVSVEPTENAPFGYWVTVSRLSDAAGYRPVLRYRSATHYGDGNTLAVIDSEMPNIQARLGVWRMGSRPPLPAGPCPKPRLVGRALWCQ